MEYLERLNLTIIHLPHYPQLSERAALAAIPNHLLVIVSPPLDQHWIKKARKQGKLRVLSLKQYQHIEDILATNPTASYSELYPLVYEKTGLLLNS